MFIRRALALVLAITWMVYLPAVVIVQEGAWKTQLVAGNLVDYANEEDELPKMCS